uniref:Serine/threonine protein phosphatase 7 long form isogeny n=1 Tax=Cajanus cajan TaxID=3821 RepID=A0A151QMG3_CAJCA|nr:Serine/threonine protein phosphatase 7 long form isogeny [Cajanus cajan]
MSLRECTITLEDVGMLVGLPIDGESVLARGTANILGLDQLLHYARAWILHFLGGLLVPDTSSCFVSLRWLVFSCDFQITRTYAWGATVLGCLYRNLCTSTDYKTPNCGGFTLLLQLWAWE